MTDAQQAAKYLRSLLPSPRFNLEEAEALEGAATIIEGFGRNENALLAENARLREALVTTTRSLSTCEQSYRLGGGREYADKLRAVLRDAWAVLRDTEAEASQ